MDATREQDATAKFSHGGNVITLSLALDSAAAQPPGDGGLLAHGSISARKLPRYPGSAPLVEEDYAAIYVTGDDPAMVSEQTLKLLREGGWRGNVSVKTDATQVLKMNLQWRFSDSLVQSGPYALVAQ